MLYPNSIRKGALQINISQCMDFGGFAHSRLTMLKARAPVKTSIHCLDYCLRHEIVWQESSSRTSRWDTTWRINPPQWFPTVSHRRAVRVVEVDVEPWKPGSRQHTWWHQGTENQPLSRRRLTLRWTTSLSNKDLHKTLDYHFRKEANWARLER